MSHQRLGIFCLVIPWGSREGNHDGRYSTHCDLRDTQRTGSAHQDVGGLIQHPWALFERHHSVLELSFSVCCSTRNLCKVSTPTDVIDRQGSSRPRASKFKHCHVDRTCAERATHHADEWPLWITVQCLFCRLSPTRAPIDLDKLISNWCARHRGVWKIDIIADHTRCHCDSSQEPVR